MLQAADDGQIVTPLPGQAVDWLLVDGMTVRQQQAAPGQDRTGAHLYHSSQCISAKSSTRGMSGTMVQVHQVAVGY